MVPLASPPIPRPWSPYLAGVNADVDCGPVGLLSLHALDVDDVLFPVDLHYFTDLLAFVVSADHLLEEHRA